MPNWCNFSVVITGPAADREKVEQILDAFECDDDGNTDARTFLIGLPDDQSRQALWIESSVASESDCLLIGGAMAWCPPLCLIDKLSKLFPTLALDCYSVTENELHERWRSSCGAEPELIERVVVDEQLFCRMLGFQDETYAYEDACIVQEYLKEGETSTLFDRNEFGEMEAQAIAIVTGNGVIA